MKIESHKPVSQFPRLTLFMGLPKVGKSTAMAQLPKALVLDLEGTGYEGIEVPALWRTPDRQELKEAVLYFFSSQNKDYKILVIDHLRMLTSFFAQDISAKHGVKFVGEVPYSVGREELTYEIGNYLRNIKKQLTEHPDKYVVFVAHAIDKNGEARLDVDGKNESLVLANVDGVGFITRDPATSKTLVSFNARPGFEAGIRNQHLSNYTGELNWEEIFKIAEGKHLEPEKKDTKKS